MGLEFTWSEIIVMVVIPWSVWVTRELFMLQSDIRSNTEMDKVVSSAIAGINDKLQKISDKLDHLELTLAQEGIKVKP